MAKKHAYVVQKEGTTPDKKTYIYYSVLVDGEELHTADTQKEAADWAIEEKEYAVHVARVRNLQDVDVPNHWRVYP